MNLKAIVHAPKTDIQIGEWKKGQIPKKDFPARAKPKAFKFGPEYDWAIIRFKALGLDCRVRVLLREGREIYYATLGVVEDGALKVIASFEFHGTEPGWHCHVRCEDVDSIDVATNRQGAIRLPRAKQHHRRGEFRVTKMNALHKALRLYRIESPGSLL